MPLQETNSNMEKRRATTQVKKSSSNKRLKRSDTSQSVDLEKPSYVFRFFFFFVGNVFIISRMLNRFLDGETANKKQRWKRPDLEKINPAQDALSTSSF